MHIYKRSATAGISAGRGWQRFLVIQAKINKINLLIKIKLNSYWIVSTRLNFTHFKIIMKDFK